MYKKLTFADREKIEQMTRDGEKTKIIAKTIGVCSQTIYRELKRGEDRDGTYKAQIAQRALFI